MKTEPARRTVKRNTAREDAFLAALLAGRGISEACADAGISRSTGIRMRQSPEFQKTYQAARDELLGAAVSALHSNAMVFVNALAQVCLDPKARGSEKATAADRGLNTLLRAVETLSLADRITKLEALVSERK